MELKTYRIPWKQRNHEPVVIAPLGDIQWSGKRGPTAKDALRRHIDRCLELGAHFIGTGDYIDFMSPSNRQRLQGAGFYDTTLDSIDDKAMELVQELYDDYLKPTRGRWIGMLHGHHWSQLRAGDTTDMRLCQMLGCDFLGTSAYVRLQFQKSGERDEPGRYNVTIWAHHGCGGSGSLGAPLRKLENIAAGFSGADIYMIGHTTKQPVAPMNRVTPRWHGHGAPDLEHKTIHLVNTGGFAASYQRGATQGRVPMGGYAEQGMMTPAVLGAPIIKITPWLRYKNGKRQMWAPEIKVEV